MYRGKSVAFVIPARNEEKLIIPTLTGIPDFVDKIYVTDDGSTDNTAAFVRKFPSKKVMLLEHKTTQGPRGGYNHRLSGGKKG